MIGSGGAGKSTLAKTLAMRLGIPCVHLDQLFWKPGWVEREKADFRKRLNRELKRPAWIMDGNFGSTMEERIQYADTIVYLDFSRWLCLWRVLWRSLQYRRRSRPDMALGCPERLDSKFLSWVWNYPKNSRPLVEARLARRPRGCRLYRFSHPAELEIALADPAFPSFEAPKAKKPSS